MTERIPDIVDRLVSREHYVDVRPLAAERFARGDIGFAADLGTAILSRTDGSLAPRIHPVTGEALRSTFGEYWTRSLLDFLIDTAPEHLDEFVRLACHPAGGRYDLAAYAAHLLVLEHRKRPEQLDAVFQTGACDDLCACLVHEFLMQDGDLDDVPAARQWAGGARGRHHPLGSLPLALTDLERVGNHIPYRHAIESAQRTRVTGNPLPVLSDTTVDPDLVHRLVRVARSWTAQSNATTDTGRFHSTVPIDPALVPDLLRTLGRACIEEYGTACDPGWTLPACSLTPEQVWRSLAWSSSRGGCYGPGEHNAYARLATWETLRALTDSPEDAPVPDVERRVRQCLWFTFDNPSWFYSAGRDLSVIALTPDRRTLTLFAATDTD
ncbi:DUF6183 family protein [Streptomyces sp. NPDC002886]|uniref:DUF6183 family protein n=1 Tax=Streptomyces sp. NPDC002886 TaxID=3364667 RepID=UPI00368123ED